MVNDTTSDLFVTAPSGVLDEEQAKLQAAYAQAMAKYVAAEKEMSRATAVVDDGKPFSMHDVPGLGRYVIPRISGWKTLLDIIHDPVPNIDFSANIYPAFDGVIGQRFNSPYLLDPLDSKYESYESLRDNLAAVRNFLMQRYFAVDSTIDGAQARKNMDEIANFVGDGLYNNFRFGGIIPNHDPDKPHIDIDRARETGGEGAQYIYECILAHNRHASGFRVFDAIKEMFGGKAAADWKLPEADKTHFTETFHKDLAAGIAPTQVDANSDIAAAIASAAANVNAIQARLDAVRDAKALQNTANDLDNIGNHLIFTATHMEGVAHLDEPVRRRAVDIAKDILRNLKVTLGNIDITQGLGLKPSEDIATLGGIKGVAKVYERLLAWARNSGDTAVFQHPSVQAATQAIAQMGYLAKREAMRMAGLAGDSVLANTIGEQLKLLPSSYIPRPGTRFGDLLDTIQSGMETILSRTQQVSVDGGQIGHALDGQLGGVNTVPTAGIGNQVGVNNAAQRNQQAMMADELAAQAEAQRINAQMAAQARKNASQSQQPVTPPRSSTTGRQARTTAQAAKQQAAASSSSRVSTTAPLNTAQQQAALRANTVNGLAARNKSAQEHEHEEQEALLRLQAQQRATAAAAKIKATALKLPPGIGFSTKGMTGAPVTPGRDISPQGVLAKRTTPGVATQTIKTQSVDGHDHVDHSHDHDLPPVQPPVPPSRGGGRGY